MAFKMLRALLLAIVIFATVILFIQFQEFMSKKSKSWTASKSRPTENQSRSEIDLEIRKGEEHVRGSDFKLLDVEKIQDTAPETPMPILFKSSFAKLPQWDFEDVYTEDPPQRPITCEHSLRNSKDEQFQKAFLPNVRLYLHKDNFKVSEWNRLSHFNNPFGFMEYKYNEVMPIVKLISKPEEPLLLPKPGGNGCMICAVVGNGGILYGSKMGADIDAHDYIFRMNGAITKGFEDDIGVRTSVYVHTAHSLTSSLSALRQYGYTAAPHDEEIKYVMIPEQISDFQWLGGLMAGEKVLSGPYKDEQPRDYYSGQFNQSRFYVLHQDFLRYVRNRFLKSSNLNNTLWSIVRPTSGAFTLFLAVQTCDIVNAYGFMTDDHAKYSNYYVEKLNKTKVTFFDKHDYRLEKDTWKNLHNSKIIWLYQRTEGETEAEEAA